MNASHYDQGLFSHYKISNNLLSVGDPTSRRSSSSADYYNRRLSTAMSSFEPSSYAKHASTKRISFNFGNEPSQNNCEKIIISEKIPAKNSVIKTPKVGTLSRFRERIRPLNKLGQFLWNHESVMLIDSTNSPQRRFNNIQTETNFAGLAY